MILYQVVSTYQLLNAVVHRLTVNKNEEDCILIISTWLTDKFPAYNDLDRFFAKIIVMNAEMKLKPDYHEKNTEYCEKLLADNGFSISDFSEIHAMGYHYNFGAYLSHNKIKHNFWEDAAGLLSSPEILININRNGFPLLAEFCEKEHLYDGTADAIDKRYCNYSAQKKDFDFENTVNFDVVEAYMTLNEEDQKAVLAFFTDVEKISASEDGVIILTQQFFSLKVMSFEEQALIYQLFVDYFFENDNIIFKTHPDDYMYYGILFPDATVIKNKFPAEFLPVLFTSKPKAIATVSSTAINNVQRYFSTSFCLGPRFETEFKFIHRYEAIYKLKNAICKDYSLDTIGVNENYNSAFKVSENKDSERKFVIIDNISTQQDYVGADIIQMLETTNDNDVFAFVNSADDYCFYNIEHKSIWKNLIPVKICKKCLRENEFYDDTHEEIIYIFTKNKEIAKKVQEFRFSKALKHTGLEIHTQPLGKDERCIILLRALLAATEYRLSVCESICGKEPTDSIRLTPIDENAVISIRYSDINISIENMDESQNKMRILEGIIRSTEQRLLFLISKLLRESN